MSKHTIGHLSPLQIRSATAYNTAMAGFVTASGTLTGDNFAEEGLDTRSVSEPMAVSAWTPVVQNAVDADTTTAWHDLVHSTLAIKTTTDISVAAGEKLEIQGELELYSSAAKPGIAGLLNEVAIKLVVVSSTGTLAMTETESILRWVNAATSPDGTLMTFAVVPGPLTITAASGHYVGIQIRGGGALSLPYEAQFIRSRLFGTIYRRAS